MLDAPWLTLPSSLWIPPPPPRVDKVSEDTQLLGKRAALLKLASAQVAGPTPPRRMGPTQPPTRPLQKNERTQVACGYLQAAAGTAGARRNHHPTLFGETRGCWTHHLCSPPPRLQALSTLVESVFSALSSQGLCASALVRVLGTLELASHALQWSISFASCLPSCSRLPYAARLLFR